MPEYQICFRSDYKTQKNFATDSPFYDDLGIALTVLKNLADKYYGNEWRFYVSGDYANASLIQIGIPYTMPEHLGGIEGLIKVGYVSKRKSTAELQELIERYNKELDNR